MADTRDMTQFVEVDDIGRVLLSYIGTEDFDKATSSLSPEAKNSFMSGIGMAGVLIMARCNKYIAEPPDINGASQEADNETG